MAYELKVYKDRTLKIIYNGEITDEEIISAREIAIAMINSNNLNKIICDIRGAFLKLDHTYLFDFSSSGKKLYPKILKAALVYSREKQPQNDNRDYKAIMRRKSLHIKIFDEYEKALQWLER